MSEKSISIQEFVEALEYKPLTDNIDLTKIKVDHKSINRPAFQLAGFYEYFDPHRIQITGQAEHEYVKLLSEKDKRERLNKLFSFRFPAILSCRGIMPDKIVIEMAEKYNVPVILSEKTTAMVIVETVNWLSERLAETDTRHGVLVDVCGEGILITGDTGIGKSETAIELVKRGHRLVADDMVEISKVSEIRLVGSAPKLTRHFVELRGIGVVDVKSLYGVECVEEEHTIDMVIHLEQWNMNNSYDRLGLEEDHEEILGLQVVKHTVPIRPGRNLALIIETAAINNRQKKMGYNAAKELVRRVSCEIKSKDGRITD